MNFIDLLTLGIEVHLTTHSNCGESVMAFRFNKGEACFRRNILQKEFSNLIFESHVTEDELCKEVIKHFNWLDDHVIKAI